MGENKTLKTVLTTFNAKYIHTSLALRWLYVANQEQHNISFSEYTIKEDPEKVCSDLLQSGCDVVGISVSIWNVEESRLLAEKLKKKREDIIIILGGPEVSYEPEYFLKNWTIDFVISGEGEFVLGELLDALEKGEDSKAIQSVSTKENVSRVTAQTDIARLTQCDSPYSLPIDREQMRNRVIYFETSRGCPYRCQYCLSSLEKGVRYFPEEHIKKNLAYLIDHGARRIKFLDRTFNLNKKHTAFVFDFLLKNYQKDLSCQFEIYADLLNDEIIADLNRRLPKDFFRFEIGIQSTYEPTNREVKRIQNFPLLAGNIQKLMTGGKVDLHLDLIAGLPFETYERFVKSFNDVFRLRAKEVQLGFLKLLRGTALRENASLYGYRYDEEAPYELIANNAISKVELDRIRRAEDALEKFWNSGRFTTTMNFLIDKQYAGRYFELFDEIGQFYEVHQLPKTGYLLEDLFRNLNQFLQTKGIDAISTLRDDYYSNFRIRPRGYWHDAYDRKERKKILYKIGQDRSFLEKHDISRRVVEKQGVVDRLGENEYLLTLFFVDNEKSWRKQLVYTAQV